MASRFYYAPIDPGYAQFGQAIAAGIGTGINNYQRGKDRQEEQRRYEERQRQLEEQLEMQREEHRRRQAEAGIYALPEAAPLPSVNVGPIGSAFVPRMTVAPAPPAPPVARIEDALGAGPGVTLPPGVQGIVPGPVAAGVAPAGPITGSFLQPPGTRGAAPAAPEGLATFEGADGRTYVIDPSKSQRAQERALEYAEKKRQQDEARGEVRNVIAAALSDGSISPQEAGELKAVYGIDASDLEDPEKAEEKAFKRRMKELEGELQLRAKYATPRGGGGGGGSAVSSALEGLTPNARLGASQEHIAGLLSEARRNGMTPDQAMAVFLSPSYREQIASVGGTGNMISLIEDAFTDRPLSASQMNDIQESLSARRLRPGTPEYEVALQEEIARAQAAQRLPSRVGASPPMPNVVEAAVRGMPGVQAGVTTRRAEIPTRRKREVQTGAQVATPDELEVIRTMKAEGKTDTEILREIYRLRAEGGVSTRTF